MAFGVKFKTVTFSKDYTPEELIEVMKQKTDWTAGEPNLCKHGFNPVIAFPPIDRQNQVWVQFYSLKGGNKVQIILSHEIAGDFKNMAKNALLDSVTRGWSSMGSVFGKKAKEGEQFVDATVAELTAMNL